ncbi:TlpA disulfide reductase family protein [Cohnella sp.]|uniref:TlpA disulfide reductase family protein n=1 Tax=Cohnella sp. TaxID=1883426 RepID=UPI003569DCEB
MNNVIVWGSLIIPVQLLLLILSGITGYFALSYRLKALDGLTHSKAILNELFNTFIVGLLVWKFSPIIYDTTFVIQNPMSLLYFSGGTTGLVLAILYSVAVLSYRTIKEKFPVLLYPDAVSTVFIAGAGMYSLLLFVFMDKGPLILLLVPVTIVFYYLQLRGRRPLGSIESIGRMMTKRGNLITAIIIIGMMGWVLYESVYKEAATLSAAGTEVNTETGIRIGNKAADFTLTTIDGKEVSLSDYRGKRVLLNFWATWCPPCKAEMPHMEKFYKEYQQDDIVVLGVNLTNTEKSSDKVKSFIENRGLTFPILLDKSGAVSDKYKVIAYPTTFIIDSSGIIRDIYQGAISYDTMKQAIQK